MSLTPEELYARLSGLIAEMPDLNNPTSSETQKWLGRASALVQATGDQVNFATFAVCAQNLSDPRMRYTNTHTIAVCLHQALAQAELNAPAAVKGTFIAAGHSFDAFAAVGNVLKTAKIDILMVDGYADEKVLTDYAVLAPEGVTVRLLTEARYKHSLKPAAERWVQQFGTLRPLLVRLAPDRKLHDREIFIDGHKAWNVGQSFKDLATRALTALSLADVELGARKIAAYQDIWNASIPI